MTEGFEVFKVYMALKNHFYGSYDFFKYQGKMSCKRETYERRKDKAFFEMMGKEREFRTLLLANFVEKDRWIGDIVEEDAKAVYKNWRKKFSSLSYIFTNDIRYLVEHDIKTASGVFECYRKKKISLETFIILDLISGFVYKYMDSKDIIWLSYKTKIDKYKPFVEKYIVSLDKFRNIVEKEQYLVER